VSPVGRSFRLPARYLSWGAGRGRAGAGAAAGMEVEAWARREDERHGRRLAALCTPPPWRRHSAVGEQSVSSVCGEMVGVSVSLRLVHGCS
jgi:hypothetical protein